MNKLLLGAVAVGGVVALGSLLPDARTTSVASPAPTTSSSGCDATGPCDSASREVETPTAPTEEPVAASTAAPVVPAPRPSSTTSRAVAAALLYPAAGGDGDSWKDRQGREYRMGLINTPEYNECYGSTATAKRKSMTAGGFRAQVYATDSYGRLVSVITTASGVNLNVYLARHGYANDKYLETFRHENPSLASRLDVAFAAAKRERAGLWGACGTARTTTTGATSSSCHPDYKTCIPIRGDGSGNGEENDLDCGDIGKPVYLRQVGVDPYRLDADGDGVGCE